MKVTSLRDVEKYIYSSVILPLQNLGVSLRMDTPISLNGSPVTFEVALERTSGRAAHNYMRDIARENLKSLVYMMDGNGRSEIVAEIDVKHNVRIFKPAIARVLPTQGRGIILSALVNSFDGNIPFKEVTVVEQYRDGDIIDISNIPF